MHKELSDAMATLGGCETPEFERATKAPKPKRITGADEYITISVAEYHCLTKAATMLEMLMQARTYERDALVRVIEAVLYDMPGGDGVAE